MRFPFFALFGMPLFFLPLLPNSAAGPAGKYARQNQPSGIYIPADKRHQGLSRFDLFPFTDRPKGDPDRYRALNPNYVLKEKGRYYFLLNVKPEAHYFDETLHDRGLLTGVVAAADLSRTKEAKAGGGAPPVRYVYVKDKGYVERTSLTSFAEIKSGKWFQFPLKPGKHFLYDGTGIARGILASEAVRLNYGQQKQINGDRCYYAFSTFIVPDGFKEKKGASGWIKASALEKGNDPQYSSEVVAKMQPPAAADRALLTEYEITGGDPQEKISPADSGKPMFRYGYADSSGNFVSYKVLPGVSLVGRASIAATDYLKRNDGVVNLGFNVAGVSNDTYRVSDTKRPPLIFHRSSENDATAFIDLFYPEDAFHDGLQSVAKMTFVYGYVHEGQAKRWGWIPLGALKQKSQ